MVNESIVKDTTKEFFVKKKIEGFKYLFYKKIQYNSK